MTFISVPNVSQSRDFSYADAVPFLGLEGVAQQLKKAVFCVQSEGNRSNESKHDDWVSHNTTINYEGVAQKMDIINNWNQQKNAQ